MKTSYGLEYDIIREIPEGGANTIRKLLVLICLGLAV